jgi:Ser/Thr protein kinase RdoA (MazF antagonist)
MSDETALAALHAWGAPSAHPTLVAERENRVYRVRLTDGRTGALRLHRPGYQSPEAIEAELTWTEALADAGFPCPRPFRTLTGALLGEPGAGRVASMVGWVDGTPMAPTPVNFRRLGHLLAGLHAVTDGLALPPLARPRWDADAFLSDDPKWGRFWQNESLTGPEQTLLLATRDAARGAMAARGAGDAGLIHADVLAENLLDDGTRLWLIDFDDAGYGDRMYDLGTALVQHWDNPALPALTQALLDGYATRRTLAADVATALPLFTLLRALASCGWGIARLPPGDPRHRPYAARAVTLARAWVGG